MSDSDLQLEEREVLLSIYEGDSKFRDISPTTYQYKYGEDNDPKSFLLEISWTEDYPTKKPTINMNTFYNEHLSANIKEKIADAILCEAEQYLGAAMTYTLFEFVKEKEADFTKEINEKGIPAEENHRKSDTYKQASSEITKEIPKKEKLTKAQKRRQWDKLDSKGEKPRGWNWVDIVKHLSQTSNKSLTESLSHDSK